MDYLVLCLTGPTKAAQLLLERCLPRGPTWRAACHSTHHTDVRAAICEGQNLGLIHSTSNAYETVFITTET